MLQTELNTESLTNIFEQFQNAIGGFVIEDDGLFSLVVDNPIGKGVIKGISLKGGISYLDFDIIFYENFTINATALNTSPIYFTYCTQGWLTYGFGNNFSNKKLDLYQTGIFANSEGVSNIFKFQKDVALKTVLVVINTTATKSNDLNAKLNELFLKDSSEPYFYVGSYNLKIAEVIRTMDAMQDKGIVRNLLIEGYINVILGLELQQHNTDLSLTNKNDTYLTVKEMESIGELSEFIGSSVDKRLSIKMLCNKVGMSPRKLQEGFKMMHNTTVTDHIREVRLLKAEELLRHTDLNVSEVVYSIGITSRSYFSKIFKNKFGFCPKDYKNHSSSLAVTA